MSIDRDELSITVKDERAITVPNGLNLDQTRRVRDFIAQACADGYALKSVAPRTKEVGSQRDPVTRVLGVVLTFAKTDAH